MLNINNINLLNYIYKKCILLNYIKYYKILKFNNINKIINIKNNNIKYIKNFYKGSNYIYLKYKNLKYINKNLKSGILLLSTSVGIITNKKAEFLKLGGVLLCYIS
uniref:Ribosomal protein S8 n=1 Tax=Babesia gibsoni TaxID=33632 RepID=A0A6M8P1X3_BABGI|nr:ribosomal protein S8 [Babesia gibsoni]